MACGAGGVAVGRFRLSVIGCRLRAELGGHEFPTSHRPPTPSQFPPLWQTATSPGMLGLL